jgi:formate dehydrogenase
MTQNATVDISRLGKRRGARGQMKGRTLDPQALADVQALLGDAPRRRDLLIEFLHRIQDHHGFISAAHIVALAQEMKLAMTEVYEVATFYHHFDVVKEGEHFAALRSRSASARRCPARWPAPTDLRAALERRAGRMSASSARPCVGRCEHAPVAVVGRNPVDHATANDVAAAVAANEIEAKVPRYVDYAAYRAQGGYRTLLDCTGGKRPLEEVIAALEHSGLRGLGGAGFPTGRKWRIVRAEPAPRLLAVNIDEGNREPSRTGISWSATRIASWKACWSPRGRWKLPTSTSTCATNTRRAARF